ncbi:hypothetical protein FSP39_005753 [Pinctada imbricata]|uniref:Transcriptional coactivator p15 (PC4) C-terminal domain-containing protein n=1 Tax=Pinctada imbricata TaxID=66713 RepID=A0AA89C344_PINIB|nr:hypothetical protein FSP39_005753 [Pinctada imbricata]
MSTPRLSVHLTNNRFVKVVEWKGDPRLDLREWHQEGKILKATKKGISLNLTQIKALIDILEEGIEDNRRKIKNFHGIWELMSSFLYARIILVSMSDFIGDHPRGKKLFQPKLVFVLDLTNTNV